MCILEYKPGFVLRTINRVIDFTHYPLLIGFAFLGLTLILLIAYSKNLDKFADFCITGIIASLLTFTLGVLTVFGHITLACSTAVVITSLLGFKPLLHGWMKKVEQQELNATLQLLLISVVILPVLPEQFLLLYR
ncbi:MAG: hypothetical protein ACXWT3_04315 [Methylococcaceae bacterium]